MIQQIGSQWRLASNFFCCTASKTTQQLWWRLTPNPSFIWLLRSFEGRRLPKPLFILFQFRRENIKSQNSIKWFKWNSVVQSIKVSKQNSVERSKLNSVKLSKQNSAKWFNHNSIKSLKPFVKTLSSLLLNQFWREHDLLQLLSELLSTTSSRLLNLTRSCILREHYLLHILTNPVTLTVLSWLLFVSRSPSTSVKITEYFVRENTSLILAFSHNLASGPNLAFGHKMIFGCIDGFIDLMSVSLTLSSSELLAWWIVGSSAALVGLSATSASLASSTLTLAISLALATLA